MRKLEMSETFRIKKPTLFHQKIEASQNEASIFLFST
jgi:hypothetical protein